MARLGVVTDGIDRNLAVAVARLRSSGLTDAELQYVGHQEVGDLTASQVREIADLQVRHRFQVTCISRHVFSGMSVFATEVSDPLYLAQLQALHRCIDLARQLRAEQRRQQRRRHRCGSEEISEHAFPPCDTQFSLQIPLFSGSSWIVREYR